MQGKPTWQPIADQPQLGAADVLIACSAALTEAVDLHPERSEWAADRLRRLEQQWRAER
jgi:hypothetical protein